MQEELEQKADELEAMDRELNVKEFDVQIKAKKVEAEIFKLVADAQLKLSQAEKEGASIDIEAFLANIRGIEAEAKYIQAITPDSTGDQNGNAGTVRDVERAPNQ